MCLVYRYMLCAINTMRLLFTAVQEGWLASSECGGVKSLQTGQCIYTGIPYAGPITNINLSESHTGLIINTSKCSAMGPLQQPPAGLGPASQASTSGGSCSSTGNHPSPGKACIRPCRCCACARTPRRSMNTAKAPGAGRGAAEGVPPAAAAEPMGCDRGARPPTTPVADTEGRALPHWCISTSSRAMPRASRIPPRTNLSPQATAPEPPLLQLVAPASSSSFSIHLSRSPAASTTSKHPGGSGACFLGEPLGVRARLVGG